MYVYVLILKGSGYETMNSVTAGTTNYQHYIQQQNPLYRTSVSYYVVHKTDTVSFLSLSTHTSRPSATFFTCVALVFMVRCSPLV